MTREEAREFKEAVKDAKSLFPLYEKYISVSRDMLPPTYSQIALEQTKKINELHDRFDQFEEMMKPVIEAYNDTKSFRKIFFALLKGVGVFGAAYVVFKMMLSDIRLIR